MMATGDKPRQNTGDGQGATEQSATASDQSGATPAPTPETPVWNTDEPFLYEEELRDPRVRRWREIMSRVHSSGWGKWPKSNVPDVKTVGEILSEHPIIQKLIE
jgi:hypothetical protein